MNKTIKICLSASMLLCAASTSIFAKELKLTPIEKINKMKMDVSKFLKKLPKNHPLNKNKALITKEVYNLNDIYVVKGLSVTPQGKRPFKINVTPSGKLVTGDVIIDGKPFTIPVDLRPFKKDAGIVIGNGKNKDKELFVFTDPDCPYCIKFEASFDELEKKGYTIYLYFYPLSFHKDAKAKSLYIMTLPKNKRMKKLAAIQGAKNPNREWDIAKEKLAKAKPILEKHLDLANKINVSGTPSVFDAYGLRIDRGTLR